MWAFLGKSGLKLKRFIVDIIVEPLIPLRRLESYLVFLARLVFRVRKPFVIGITGSVGKSTTTAMVAAVLSHRDAERIVGAVGHTSDNMNDDVGLSATLLRFESFYVLPWPYPHRLAMLCLTPFRALRVMMGRYPKVMVLEFGVGSTADFNRMVTIAPPDVAVVTRIGAAHLEIMKTVEALVQEKGALVRAVRPSGLVILGQDHDYVSQLEQMARAPVIKVSGQGVELSQNITRAVCRHMGIPEEVVNSALREFKPPKGRLNRLEFVGMTVIDDSYNANPLSMKLALDTLAEADKLKHRRLAVLGFMAELGKESPRYHVEVGAYARSRADILIGVGDLSKHYNPNFWFETSDACAAQIENLVRFNDCLLVKGSFAAQMERVVNKLCEIADKRQRVSSQP
jgi:UDP-N-acetylmuramoyl-tripeptide--D-alanyl-D-alanine ligase